MDIAVMGATGAVGSALVVHLLKSTTLGPGDRLVLCGHHTPTTERHLLPEQNDLRDAFDDRRVRIEVADDYEDIRADIVVITPGATTSAEHPTRRDLAAVNRPLFESISRRCAARLPNALFVVVSNPVELAVDIFSRVVDRCRVIGMGAEQDSLRFGRAVAEALGLSRHAVRTTVMGEHGAAMVPIWSSIELLTPDSAAVARLAALRERCAPATLAERAASLRAAVGALLAEERIAEAYTLTRSADPDARILVEPFITMHCLRSTPHATANAAYQVIDAIVADDGRRVAGQVRLEGEALALTGTFGLPLALDRSGWRVGLMPYLEEAELRAVRASAADIANAIATAHAGAS